MSNSCSNQHRANTLKGFQSRVLSAILSRLVRIWFDDALWNPGCFCFCRRIPLPYWIKFLAKRSCFPSSWASSWLKPYCHSFPQPEGPAIILDRLQKANYPLSGASDHGVYEALYLDDPDENGVELYWDRPKESWTYQSDGAIKMFTLPLDIEGLLAELS